MTTFALIPGADGTAWYWHRLVPELRSRGYDVVTMEMPTEVDAALAAYTAAVVDAIGDRAPVVVVAQSIGGFVGPLVAERVPTELLVLVNAMVPVPGESAAQWWENTGQPAAHAEAARRAGRDPHAAFDPMIEFFHDVPTAIRDEAMSGTPSSPSEAFFADPWPLRAWPDVPTRFFQGRDDRFFPIELQRRVVSDRLGIEVEEIPGGHLNALSQPKMLAEKLDAAVRAL